MSTEDNMKNKIRATASGTSKAADARMGQRSVKTKRQAVATKDENYREIINKFCRMQWDLDESEYSSIVEHTVSFGVLIARQWAGVRMDININPRELVMRLYEKEHGGEGVGNRSPGNAERERAQRDSTADHVAIFLDKFVRILRDEVSNLTLDAIYLSLGSILPAEHSSDRKDIAEKISRLTARRRKKLLGVGPGGARNRGGFRWTAENKVKFREAVEELPKVADVAMWDFAYEELNEKNFSSRIIDYLKEETVFKQAPDRLLDEAVKAWRPYGSAFSKPPTHHKPEAFAFRHALTLLGFPETKHSTLKKYYGQAKSLRNNKIGTE